MTFAAARAYVRLGPEGTHHEDTVRDPAYRVADKLIVLGRRRDRTGEVIRKRHDHRRRHEEETGGGSVRAGGTRRGRSRVRRDEERILDEGWLGSIWVELLNGM